MGLVDLGNFSGLRKIYGVRSTAEILKSIFGLSMLDKVLHEELIYHITSPRLAPSELFPSCQLCTPYVVYVHMLCPVQHEIKSQ
jgi:type III secretory pathway component EscU